MHKTYFNWSSGKDSALALYLLQKNKQYSVEKLLTTISKEEQRVGMHGLRKEMLLAQTKNLNIPHQIIELESSTNHDNYNKLMLDTNSKLKKEGFTHTAFGDIFLEDLRDYREHQLELTNIHAIFPLWKKDTKELMHTFLDLGFKTMVVAASDKFFNKDFVGTVLDKKAIANLPSEVDPCGENGEFHTFCFDGPIFDQKVDYRIGEKVHKTYPNPQRNKGSKSEIGFWFCDLLMK